MNRIALLLSLCLPCSEWARIATVEVTTNFHNWVGVGIPANLPASVAANPQCCTTNGVHQARHINLEFEDKTMLIPIPHLKNPDGWKIQFNFEDLNPSQRADIRKILDECETKAGETVTITNQTYVLSEKFLYRNQKLEDQFASSAALNAVVYWFVGVGLVFFCVAAWISWKIT